MSRFLAACVLGSCAAQGDLASQLRGSIASIAQRVALEDGYGEEFAKAFSPSKAGELTEHSARASAFVNLNGNGAKDVVTLRPPEETTDDIANAVASLEAAGTSARASGKKTYSATWQRMLEAESLALQASMHAAFADHAVRFAASSLQTQDEPLDLRALAKLAVEASNAYLNAAKHAPTAADIESQLAKADTVSGTSFLGAPQGDDATLRVVEPSGLGAKASASLRRALEGALTALEARQQVDEGVYAQMLARSQALP